jgi:hypothetical protein
MLARQTCLLLGAGGSSHLGFPLGDELRRRMITKLERYKNYRNEEELPEQIRFCGEDLTAFYDKLAYGNWRSPDAFLERHREFIHTGKYLICSCLSELEKPERIPLDGGWYDRLVSAIHVDDKAKIRDNRLSIVTFNYDRSIDFRLHKYIEHHFGISSEESWQLLRESIPIVHVHGTLGEYPKWEYGDTSNIWERSQDIKVISEIGERTPEFQRASQLLNEAERVVVFGFGFGLDNVRRLMFFREQEHDERDIIVAIGGSKGQNHSKENEIWLAKWGLRPNTHHFACVANQLFDQFVNPFA